MRHDPSGPAPENRREGPALSVEAIRKALAGPLPGPAAQLRMAPSGRRVDPLDGTNWKQAAVLVLLYPVGGELRFPLTRRHDDLPHHPGQISLPGGSLEKDEGPEEAALRETAEELGVDPAGIEILGRLSPLKIPPSRFEIVPFVGYLPERPVFLVESREVAELFEAPLSILSEREATGVEEWDLRGGPSSVPFWKIGGHKVWGATAMVLAELATVLECSGNGRR